MSKKAKKIKMAVYISSSDSDDARMAAIELEAAGFTVSSNWHGKPFADETPEFPGDKAGQREAADMNIAAIAMSDAVLMMVPDYRCLGGCYVEAGVAIGLGKRLVLVGDSRPNILLHASDAERAKTVKSAISLLKRKKSYAF